MQKMSKLKIWAETVKMRENSKFCEKVRPLETKMSLGCPYLTISKIIFVQ